MFLHFLTKDLINWGDFNPFEISTPEEMSNPFVFVKSNCSNDTSIDLIKSLIFIAFLQSSFKNTFMLN